MNIQVEISFYPLGTDTIGEAIDSFIDHLSQAGMEVEVGAMSSLLNGETKAVFEALAEAFEATAARWPGALVIKVSNACPVSFS